jgi:hypothetical protein
LTYKINGASKTTLEKNVDVKVADKVLVKKNYKSTPYVTIGNVLLTSKDYKLAYVDEQGNSIKTNDLRVGQTIYVQIQGKGAYSGLLISKSYKLLSEAKIDLSTAKLKVNVKKDYTGTPITLDDSDWANVTLTIGSTKYSGYNLQNLLGNFDVTYANNTNKGSATIIISGKEGNNDYVGSISGKFTINNLNLKKK